MTKNRRLNRAIIIEMTAVRVKLSGESIYILFTDLSIDSTTSMEF